MAQTLLIGLGGTGSRVVNNVVKQLHRNGKEINNGEICCAVLDTNENDNELIVESRTGVPVIGTSKPQKIRTYFQDYHHLNMDSWCPQSPAFLEESMIDGASEARVKSRIAFMDSVESGVIEELELMINEILKTNPDSKIRIMLVSSLSGGTGSGMFIQVALWLRKFLSESEITIRGIFMLPDVFVSTVDDIRNNLTTRTRHYANAYAAIRELNAITKIRKSGLDELGGRITLDKLFDSDKDANAGKPVFDFAFFVDDRDENGVRLDSIAEYEEAVAQLVYMQLYAPMRNNMYSEEDNTFLAFTANEEPLYGSCGTSKAVYSSRSTKNYCALRAAQDSLTGGWKKIDSEIDALVEEEKERERDGIFSASRIDPRAQFIRIFDEKSKVTAEETGRDRFFLSIARDIKNETTYKTDEGKVAVRYTDKVEDFLELLRKDRIDRTVTRYGGTEAYVLPDSFFTDEHTKEALLEQISADAADLEGALDKFDEKVDEYADGILNAVFPYSMGEVKPENRYSIYGLFTKKNDAGRYDFIHPVAARYVLYKLKERLLATVRSVDLDHSRRKALDTSSPTFDNPKTKESETDPRAFLESRKFTQREEKFFDDFEQRYAEFIRNKVGLCESYQKELLLVRVCQRLGERVDGLIEQIEAFFRRLGEVERKLFDELEANIAQTAGIVGKTTYVLGDRASKESIYSQIDFGLDTTDTKINKSVIDAIYGRLCAEKRPSNKENEAYLNAGVITIFTRDTVKFFRDKIDSDSSASELVNMDIYTAICKEADTKFAAAGGKDAQSGGLDDLDLETGEVKQVDYAARRHAEAFKGYTDQLFRMAAPMLVREREISDNALGTVTTRTKTFWGYNPAVAAACPQLGTILGINAGSQAHRDYPTDELYCYRAVYGLEAALIPKFNEQSGGDYYTCYSAIVGDMLRDADGRAGSYAYVRSPHLDKTWHTVLPYVTGGKQKQDELAFYHGLWLAIAYGAIRTDREGCAVVSRAVDSGFGTFVPELIPLVHAGEAVARTDIASLLDALRADKVFTDSDIPGFEAKFAGELKKMSNYVGTEVLGGLTDGGDFDPVSLVVRYLESAEADRKVYAKLVGSLEKIVEELVENFLPKRTAAQREEAKWRICKKIYDAGGRTKGRSEAFASWEDAFKRHNIKDGDPIDAE